MATAFSIIIPNFNGKELLRRYLPSVIKACECSSLEHEIIIVEDGSTDGSAELISNQFPTVRIICQRNKGFIGSCNLGAMESRYNILLFLNSDVKVEEDFIELLIDHFSDEEIFAVAPRIINPDGSIESITRGISKFGIVDVEFPAKKTDNSRFNETLPILYPCGAAFACKKDKFLKLGGFDDLYFPGYSEDLDLGYRAWKRGWKVLYEPRSIVYHNPGSTFQKMVMPSELRIKSFRNKILFMWKNITDKSLIFQHILFFLPYIFHKTFIKGELLFPIAVFCALCNLGKVFRKRAKERRFIKLSDREVLLTSSSFPKV